MEKAKTFTQFKEDIRKWKDAHREEYNRFARCMANGDERQYFEIFKAVALQSVKTARTMELCWGDDSAEDFEDVFISFKEDALPESIARLASEFQGIGFSEKNEDARQIGRKGILASLRRIFGRRKPEPTVKISAPLVLSWLFFGKSFEAMVLMTDKLVAIPMQTHWTKGNVLLQARPSSGQASMPATAPKRTGTGSSPLKKPLQMVQCQIGH